MTTRPFTVGIIQDSASPDTPATLEASVARVREAASRGAQIICLKELFNAPYFCKSQKAERFDYAEPLPGAAPGGATALWWRNAELARSRATRGNRRRTAPEARIRGAE